MKKFQTANFKLFAETFKKIKIHLNLMEYFFLKINFKLISQLHNLLTNLKIKNFIKYLMKINLFKMNFQ